MSVHLIEELAEDATAAMIATIAGVALTGVTTYKGFSGSDFVIPRLEVFAFESEPEIIGETTTGNHQVSMRFTVVTSADDKTRAQHSALVSAVRDTLMALRTDVVTEIEAEATANFTAFTWTPGATSREVDDGDRLHMTTIEGVLYCAPSDI